MNYHELMKRHWINVYREWTVVNNSLSITGPLSSTIFRNGHVEYLDGKFHLSSPEYIGEIVPHKTARRFGYIYLGDCYHEDINMAFLEIREYMSYLIEVDHWNETVRRIDFDPRLFTISNRIIDCSKSAQWPISVNILRIANAMLNEPNGAYVLYMGQNNIIPIRHLDFPVTCCEISYDDAILLSLTDQNANIYFHDM